MSLWLVTVEATDDIDFKIEAVVLAYTEMGARKMVTRAVKNRGYLNARSTDARAYNPYTNGIVAMQRLDLHIAFDNRGDLLAPA